MTGIGLGLAAAAIAVLELDATAAGQFMASRPLIIGPTLGIVLGNPALGACLGAFYELLGLNDPPVGGRLPLNATVAVSSALFLALGTPGVPAEIAFPAGAVLGWGQRRLEERFRASRGRLGPLVDQRLNRGLDPGLGRLALCEMAKQAAATFSVMLFALWLGSQGGKLSAWVPGRVLSGLRVGLAFLPWLAGASLLRSFKVAL